MDERVYAVIGTGAVGGFYGSRLVEAGCSVHFLLHSDYDKVRDHGLLVESPLGDIELREGSFSGGFHESTSTMPACDVVLVALKTTSNHLLATLLPPLVGEHTTVVMLQNGLGVEAEAADVVGGAHVVGGMCFLCSNKVGPRHVRHLDYGLVTLADFGPDGRSRGITSAMSAIGQDFARTRGVPITLEEDLTSARWRKLVWNIPFNGLSVVLDAATNELMADAASRALAAALIEEVVAGGSACGAVMPAAFTEQMLGSTTAMKPYMTSMKLDHDAGRPLEIEAMYGRPLGAATLAGVEMPLTTMLYRELGFIDGRLRATGPASRQD